MRSELLRYVVAAGVVVRDERKRLPGRGAWLHDNPECLRLALTRNAFARTLHIPRTAVISPAMD
jgi:predicted RNA-binding protein YlxR (DUF448 family)